MFRKTIIFTVIFGALFLPQQVFAKNLRSGSIKLMLVSSQINKSNVSSGVKSAAKTGYLFASQDHLSAGATTSLLESDTYVAQKYNNHVSKDATRLLQRRHLVSWNTNALDSAKIYLHAGISKHKIKELLLNRHNKFTKSEVNYALSHLE